jgi:hypothetical protein
MHEAIDDIYGQNDKSCDPPQVRQRRNAGKPECAPGVVAQIDDGDLDDDCQAQRRHREIVPAQPQHRPAHEDSHEGRRQSADQQRRQVRHL